MIDLVVTPSLLARFWSEVNKSGPIPAHRPELGECHVWIAGTNKYGYGRFGIWAHGEQHAELAHRVAFFLADGRWPRQHALHHCDNPPCVRRSHLFEGDQVANNADAKAKGRVKPGHVFGELHGCSRLTAEQVLEIRALVRSGDLFQREIAERFGVSQVMVSRIALRKAWSHL